MFSLLGLLGSPLSRYAGIGVIILALGLGIFGMSLKNKVQMYFKNREISQLTEQNKKLDLQAKSEKQTAEFYKKQAAIKRRVKVEIRTVEEVVQSGDFCKLVDMYREFGVQYPPEFLACDKPKGSK